MFVKLELAWPICWPAVVRERRREPNVHLEGNRKKPDSFGLIIHFQRIPKSTYEVEETLSTPLLVLLQTFDRRLNVISWVGQWEVLCLRGLLIIQVRHPSTPKFRSILRLIATTTYMFNWRGFRIFFDVRQEKRDLQSWHFLSHM